MNASTRSRQRLLKRIALGLAVAAIFAPSAQAIDPKVAPDRSDTVVFPTSDERDSWRIIGQALAETLPADVRVNQNSNPVVFPTSDEREAWRAYGQTLARTLPAGGQGGIDIDSVIFPTTEERDAAREAAQALVDDVAAPTQAASPGSFDFTDAVIGGAVVLGVMLIAFAAALFVRSRQRLAQLQQ